MAATDWRDAKWVVMIWDDQKGCWNPAQMTFPTTRKELETSVQDEFAEFMVKNLPYMRSFEDAKKDFFDNYICIVEPKALKIKLADVWENVRAANGIT